MTLLPFLLATRAFVIVSPETVESRAEAAKINHQLRSVLRSNRADTFAVMSLSYLLNRKKSVHAKKRKEASKLLAEARRAYGELDVEGAIKTLEQALIKAEAGLASSKGTGTWLSIQLELGLRLWEMDDARGAELVARTLALAPKQKFPAGTQLTDEMRASIDKMRKNSGGSLQAAFTSEVPLLVEVAGRTCVTPCSINGLPAGRLPWRASAPGIETIGGVTQPGAPTAIPSVKIAKRQEFLARLSALWTLESSEADLLLAEQKDTFPKKPVFIVWLRVGDGRISLLRGQVVPKAALFYRGSRNLTGPLSDADLLAWIKSTMSDDAAVGAPVTDRGFFYRVGQWWPKMPSLSMPSLPKFKISKKALTISGATVVGSAAIAGLAYYLSNQPSTAAHYDPVLGF